MYKNFRFKSTLLKESYLSSTPTTDKLATDGWSGDASAVAPEDVATMEQLLRSLIADVKAGRDVSGTLAACETWLANPRPLSYGS